MLLQKHALLVSKGKTMTMRLTYPGVYIEIDQDFGRRIDGVATSITAFVGRTRRGPKNVPVRVTQYSEFEGKFGVCCGIDAFANAVNDFFTNGGSEALIVRLSKRLGSPGRLFPAETCYKTAFDALGKTEMFNLLCLPPVDASGDVDVAILKLALKLCVDHRAFLIVDPRSTWLVPDDVLDPSSGLDSLGLGGVASRNAAVYFPRVTKVDPEGRGGTVTLVPCGAVAGVIARMDARRGVWNAAAGMDAEVKGIQGLSLSVTSREISSLSQRAVNCIREVPIPVLWGARTLRGDNNFCDVYKYIPVRRLALLIEESIFRGTQWAVFEPNDEPLWAQIRLHVGAFMHNLFRQGAFRGATPRETYFFKCDGETTTQADIASGRVNIFVGFAPLKPGEFVVVKIQQHAFQSSS